MRSIVIGALVALLVVTQGVSWAAVGAPLFIEQPIQVDSAQAKGLLSKRAHEGLFNGARSPQIQRVRLAKLNADALREAGGTIQIDGTDYVSTASLCDPETEKAPAICQWRGSSFNGDRLELTWWVSRAKGVPTLRGRVLRARLDRETVIAHDLESQTVSITDYAVVKSTEPPANDVGTHDPEALERAKPRPKLDRRDPPIIPAGKRPPPSWNSPFPADKNPQPQGK
jgi:hypothetical protein